jgi:hypothetical protein
LAQVCSACEDAVGEAAWAVAAIATPAATMAAKQELRLITSPSNDCQTNALSGAPVAKKAAFA